MSEPEGRRSAHRAESSGRVERLVAMGNDGMEVPAGGVLAGCCAGGVG